MRWFCLNKYCVILASLLFVLIFYPAGPMVAQTVQPDCINDGDVNGDGQITSADAQLAFNIALGAYTPTYEEACAADCNGDIQVTSADAQSIFYVVLGLSTCVDLPPLPRFSYIQAGTYRRGSSSQEPCRLEPEGPQHTVILTRSFFMMTTEVTRRMWSDLKAQQPTLPDDPSDIQSCPTNLHPAQSVTWQEAILFANLWSLEEGHEPCYYADPDFTIPIDHTNYTDGSIYCKWNADGFRLPTEAEWEYAARAGSTGPFSFSEPNYWHDTCESCYPDTLPVMKYYVTYCATSTETAGIVRSKFPNPWKLYDMHGNVWEWCWDIYGAYQPDTQINPTGPETGANRVIRGGGWNGFPRSCRSANRSNWTNLFRSKYVGFRLVRSAPLVCC